MAKRNFDNEEIKNAISASVDGKILGQVSPEALNACCAGIEAELNRSQDLGKRSGRGI